MPYADPHKRREYQKQYKAANHDRLREMNRVWRKRRSSEDPEFRARERATEKRWRERNPETVREKNKRDRPKFEMVIRDSNLKSLYGIDRYDYERMFEDQEGRCAICGTDEPGGKKKYLSVDHCHGTGLVRGLLCDFCNNGLGRFKDSADLLKKAIGYLKDRSG